MGKLKDLEGQRFGRLTVLSDHKIENKSTFWKCMCDCGNEKWVRSSYFTNRTKNGHEVSCGCHEVVDMSGKVFGRLIVLNEFKRTEKETFWRCICDCGNKRWIRQSNLKHRLSCGCYRKEYMSEKMKGEYGAATKNNVYCDYRKSARSRSYNFQLNFETFINIIQQNCNYCGSSPSHIEKSKCDNGDFVYSGIDRVNNKKGYTKGNVVACCEICNRMKMAMGKKDFLNWIKKIYKFNFK